jgi:ABC-type branched-subunit amino acid transport system ATPase component
MFPFMGRAVEAKSGTLSGGEQAMVKVARALLDHAAIYAGRVKA